MVPGTQEWAEALASNARRYADFTDDDVRPLIQRYRDLADYKAWFLLLPDEPRTKERFCTEILGKPSEWLDLMDHGVTILDNRGHSGKVPAAKAERAVAEAKALKGRTINKGPGPISQEEREKDEDIVLINSDPVNRSGNRAAYLARRIRRDHPDIFARMEAGEFRSIHAAALEAGIARHAITVRTDDPESAARTLRKHMSPGNLTQLVEILADEA